MAVSFVPGVLARAFAGEECDPFSSPEALDKASVPEWPPRFLVLATACTLPPCQPPPRNFANRLSILEAGPPSPIHRLSL